MMSGAPFFVIVLELFPQYLSSFNFIGFGYHKLAHAAVIFQPKLPSSRDFH
jgi:hypothetical protein